MKKILVFIITLIISLIYIDNLKALTGYTTESLNVRTEPNTGSTIVATLPSNRALDVVSEELYNVGDKSCDIGWYKINYNNAERYVCGKWVSLGNVPDKNPGYNETTFEARVTETAVPVRSSAVYLNNNTKMLLVVGTNVKIIGDKIYKNDKCTDGWYYISYHKNDTGYICSTYVKKKEELTATDSNYEQQLRGLGFPDSYIPYLVKLHNDHPNWSFQPIKINYDWKDIVNVENGKNSIHINYLDDVIKEIYTTGYHEPSFRTTTSAVDAFFLDPRNFLSEKLIFMFESQKYNYGNDDRNTFNPNSASSQRYYQLISSIIPSGLNQDSYKYAFIEGGFRYNVSPVHLVSRVKQEGASLTGTTSLTYRGYNLNGYYNLFNIGAYEDEHTANPVARGLAYACGSACGFDDTNERPWNTIEKSIKGGAYHIAKNYIEKSQNLIYFEKFNTNEPNFSSVGTFQYMTNLVAPSEESESIYNTYKNNGKLEDPYVFEIPIYNNMPEYVSLPEIASRVNTLNEILVNGKKITSEEMDITDYVTYVSDTLTSVEITGTKTDSNSTVIGLGTVNLTGETTEHKIIVTAENGDVKTYYITIKKARETTDDIVSKLSVKVNGDVMYGISPDTYVSTLEQSVAKASPSATVNVYTNTSNIVASNSLLATGQTIKITASSGETKTYRLAITGDTNGDGIVDVVDLLRVQKHILNTTKLTDLNFIGGDTNNDGVIDILDLLKVQKHILKLIKL